MEKVDNIIEELKELTKDKTIEALELLKEQIELRVKQLKS